MHLDEKILAGGGGGGSDLDTAEDLVSLGGTGGAGGPAGETAASSQMRDSFAPTSSNMFSNSNNVQQPQLQQVDHLEHISLQFDKPTTYLSIPLKKFKNGLQNEGHRVNIGTL